MNRFDRFVRELRARRHVGALSGAVRKALGDNRDPIPVLVVSFQNGRYVRNTVSQLGRFGLKPIIMDNCSQDAASLEVLRELETQGTATVVRSGFNFGHLVGFLDEVYEALPPVFAYTDPDLQYSADLPKDFLNVLADLTTKYRVYKAGLALDLLPGQAMIANTYRRKKKRPFPFQRDYSVREWEQRYWRFPIAGESLEMFAAGIDTTMAVYRKENFAGNFHDAIRVAGPYRAIHLPWFPELDLLSAEERSAYLKKNRSSAWVR